MILRFCILSLYWFAALAAAENRIAIVIDDIGYRQTDSHALDLPGELTFSVLPQTPHGKTLALKANQKNKEVLLHIPMESENGKRLGPGALTHRMSEANIRASLERSFEEIPFAVGINNHMGSLLTQLYRPMSWIMQFLKERELLFLDSLTTEYSRGREIALDYGVPTLNRHVFLDNQLTDEYIAGQFQELIERAKTYRSAVAIAHPHPETVAALNELLPTLAEHNITLVPLSALLADQYSAKVKAKTAKGAKAD